MFLIWGELRGEDFSEKFVTGPGEQALIRQGWTPIRPDEELDAGGPHFDLSKVPQVRGSGASVVPKGCSAITPAVRPNNPLRFSGR